MGNAPTQSQGGLEKDLNDVRRMTESDSTSLMDDGDSDGVDDGLCVMLSSIKPTSHTAGMNPQGSQVICFGNHYPNGIFMQAQSTKVSYEYDVAGKFKHFKASIAINDTAQASDTGSSVDPIYFTISGKKEGETEQHLLYRSTGLTSRNDFISIRVNIEGVMQLQIAVQLEGQHTAHAHAIWVDPRLTLSDSWGATQDSHGFQIVEDPEAKIDVSKIHHTGQVEKKGDDMLGLWSTRFFVMDGHTMRWFKDEDSYQNGDDFSGSLHLNDIRTIRQIPKKPRYFSLEKAGRVYELKAAGAAEVRTWVGLIHLVCNVKDLSLRRSDEGDDRFANTFTLHSVKEGDGSALQTCNLHFDEVDGITAVDGTHWSCPPTEVHKFVRMPAAEGNGNRFALCTLSYKFFEGASQSQLQMIEESVKTITGAREKPAAAGPIKVFTHASLNMFENDCEFIAKGGYGKVFKVKERSTGNYYALKVIEMGSQFNKDFIDSAIKEKEVLVGVASGNPFLISLHSAWHQQSNVFLCLELAEAGDLTNVMKQHHQERFPVHLAGFYCAEVINVIRFLHARGIVYRDLKPENLLVHTNGHIKLADFGLAKGAGAHDSSIDMTTGCTTFKGTPEYYAPEVLQAGQGGGAGYGFAADWWAVGILFYEMQAGLYQTPFPSGNRDQTHLNRMYSNILNKDFKWPDPLPVWAERLPAMRSLIEGLLIKDPLQRLGTPTSGGITARSGDNLVTHEYFREELPQLLGLSEAVNLDMIDKVLLTPPWAPAVGKTQRPRFNLGKYQGIGNDRRLDQFGSFDGSAAEGVQDGAAFLHGLGFQ